MDSDIRPTYPQEAKDFARSLKKGTGADLTASGATRVAGTTNYKRKYEPDFPIVTIRDSTPGRIMTAIQLESLGLVAAPEPITVLPSSPARVYRRSEAAIRARKWPDYERSLQSAPPNHGNTGPDRSRADFTWCMTALDWGFDIPETTAKLLECKGQGEWTSLCCPYCSERSRSRREERAEGGQRLVRLSFSLTVHPANGTVQNIETESLCATQQLTRTRR